MFAELFNSIGTRKYKADEFNNRMHSCTSGLTVSLDKYSASPDHENLHDRNEQLLFSTGFLDRNTDQAFECLQEILSTPNFDDASNLSNLIKMSSI